jgi:mRNA interferase MazF
VAPRGGSFVPERGDLIWLDFDPQAGHEQSGRRPAVVLSPAAYNGRTGLALCCPITSQRKGYPFEEELPSGSSIGGVALTDQVRSLDWRARNASLAGRLPSGTIAAMLGKARALLQ